MKCPVASLAAASGFNVNEIYISILWGKGGRSRNIESDKAKELRRQSYRKPFSLF